MRSWLRVVIAAFLVAAGCSSQKGSLSRNSSNSGNLNAPAGSTATAANSSSDSDTPIPPEGAQYTILCNSYTGPTHIIDAKKSKDYLVEKTGSKEWYVVHQEDRSNLYYGYYKTFEDRTQPDEYDRAQSDRAKVASLLDLNGDRLFQQVMFVPITLPDPEAPKEWELSANPGFWTLQIAIYRDSPLIKQYAVDATKQARAMGIEAYYHHSVGTSEVYVGSWPREAVKEQESDSAVADNADEPLLVLSGPIAGSENNDFYTKDGRKMKVVMPKVEVIDPSLKQMIAKYPNTWINGDLRGKKMKQSDGSTKVEPYPSMLVAVPHGDSDQPRENAPKAEESPIRDPFAQQPDETVPPAH